MGGGGGGGEVEDKVWEEEKGLNTNKGCLAVTFERALVFSLARANAIVG